jgi:hypothetical protein
MSVKEKIVKDLIDSGMIPKSYRKVVEKEFELQMKKCISVLVRQYVTPINTVMMGERN